MQLMRPALGLGSLAPLLRQDQRCFGTSGLGPHQVAGSRFGDQLLSAQFQGQMFDFLGPRQQTRLG